MDRLKPPDWVPALASLVPGLVHEFRNPLSGVLAGCQMLHRLIPAPSPAREYIEIVLSEARALEGYLARLAEFGRLRDGDLTPTDALDLPALVGRSLQEAQAACQAHGVRQTTAFDPRVQHVWGDPIRLGRAFWEVVTNAVEAMPEGGTLAVRTRLAAQAEPSGAPAPRPVGEMAKPGRIGVPPGRPVARSPDCQATGWAEIEFADTGPGMTEEVRRRACEPFFSTRPRGLGIGLPLAHAILLAHGGALELASAPAQGTRVCLRLPLTT